MLSAHCLSARPVPEVPCCSLQPSCSYAVAQPRFPFTNRRLSQRAGPSSVCRCSASSPAQLDSARLQENGVGKAQAGTASCLHHTSSCGMQSLTAAIMLYSSHDRSCCTSKAQRPCEKRDQGDQSGCHDKHRRHRSLQSADTNSFSQSHARCRHLGKAARFSWVHVLPCQCTT